MSSSMFLGLFDWVGDFFKSLFDLFPKLIYLLYASLSCLMDILQLFFRKLAGLDVYYIDGQPVSGDLVTNFISGILGINFEGNNNTTTYSSLSTVFYAFLLFGIIICFVSTLVAIIKSHYSYDEKAAKGPMQHVYTALKSILNIAVVPLVIVLGLYVSQALLRAVDSFTSNSSASVEAMYGKDAVKELCSIQTADLKEETYMYYDIFGVASGIYYGTDDPDDLPFKNFGASERRELQYIGSTQETFSGSLFRVAAYTGNRIRTGHRNRDSKFTGNGGGGSNLFKNAESDDELANMIDFAFANNLHYTETKTLDYGDGGCFASTVYFNNWYAPVISSFSKFNVGAIWYYYDLWNFNFIVGFGAIVVCFSVILGIVFGLMSRVLMCVALFLVMPAAFGLTPLDGGKIRDNWKAAFLKQVLMTFGSVLGMNLMFMILPYINDINFFNIEIADYFAQTLFIIVGLLTIKSLIAVLSSAIGSESAADTGEKMKEDIGRTVAKGVKGVATGGKMIGGAFSLFNNGRKHIVGGINKIRGGMHEQKAKDARGSDEWKEVYKKMVGKDATSKKTKEEFLKDAENAGISEGAAKRRWKHLQAQIKSDRRKGIGDGTEDSIVDKDGKFESLVSVYRPADKEYENEFIQSFMEGGDNYKGGKGFNRRNFVNKAIDKGYTKAEAKDLYKYVKGQTDDKGKVTQSAIDNNVGYSERERRKGAFLKDKGESQIRLARTSSALAAANIGGGVLGLLGTAVRGDKTFEGALGKEKEKKPEETITGRLKNARDADRSASRARQKELKNRITSGKEPEKESEKKSDGESDKDKK